MSVATRDVLGGQIILRLFITTIIITTITTITIITIITVTTTITDTVTATTTIRLLTSAFVDSAAQFASLAHGVLARAASESGSGSPADLSGAQGEVWKAPLKSKIRLENATDNPLENATENPR